MNRLSMCVTMCTYNGSRFLRDQLESMERQTRRPDRLVIVDDASTDETREIVREFTRSAGFPVELLENPENLGFRRSFARAIDAAAGEVIVLADQDDVWMPHKLEALEARFLADEECGILFSDAAVVDEELTPKGFRLWEAIQFTTERQELVEQGQGLEVLLRRNVVTGATMAFRSRFVELVLPLDREAVHDGWISLLIAAVSGVGLVREPLILYRQHGSNQIGAELETMAIRIRAAQARNKEILAEQLGLIDRVMERLERKPGYGEVRRAALGDATEHLRTRLQLPRRRLLRLPGVWKEFTRGGYRRCGNGMSSVLRDLLV